MKQKEIIEAIIKYIDYQEQDCSTISADDYSQDRKSCMVVVGITNTEQIYPNLPDYKYTLSIIVDCFIADDSDGAKLNSVKNIVSEKMNQIVFKKISLQDVFGEIPVVGFIAKNMDFSVIQDSNRVEFSFELFCSLE